MAKLLRLAKETDGETLLDIYRYYVEETSITFETEVPTLREFQGRIRDTLTKFPYLVLEEDGEILGYAYAHPFHQRAAYNWTVETSIYVRKNPRRGGVGTCLYEALFDMLRRQGVQALCAIVTVPNEPSMAFHQRMGFSVAGTIPRCGYKLGQWHGVAYLYRLLSEGGEAPPPLRPLRELPEALLAPRLL